MDCKVVKIPFEQFVQTVFWCLFSPFAFPLFSFFLSYRHFLFPASRSLFSFLLLSFFLFSGFVFFIELVILLSYFCLTKRPNVGGAQKSQAQPHFLNLQSKVKVATLQSLVLNIHLFALKIKKLFGNRANQLRHLGSLRLLTLSLLAKMFQRACRQKQPEQRLFLLSAPPAPS